MLKKDTYDSGFTAGRNEGISIGLSQGEKKAKLETAKNLLSIGLSQKQIVSVTGLSPEEIEKL
jgi:predicted transposase/invertase (TIGR01784 family)